MYSTFDVDPHPPSNVRQSQSSLEHIFSLNVGSPLPSTNELADAELLYHEIVRGCKEARVFITPPGTTPEAEAEASLDPDYDDDDRVYLDKFFESLLFYCPTPAGRNNIIRMVLIALFVPTPDPANQTARSLTTIIPLARQYLASAPLQRSIIFNTLKLLAHEILNSFFIPLKAQGRNTPSVTSLISPTSRSEASPYQGVKGRLFNLRALVLARDNYACVVSGMPDRQTLESRMRRRRAIPKATITEAAHIIPHSLNALDNRPTLSAQKHTVWRVLNMFDPGVTQTLEGELIDSPANSILLAQELHNLFGKLAAYFEEVEGETEAYRFLFVEGYAQVMTDLRPRDRITFANHEPLGTAKSQLPSRRLLRLHRACCLILSMSGAAGYAEKVLDDAEELLQRGVLATDGGSNLSVLRVRGLCDDAPYLGWESSKEVLVK